MHRGRGPGVARRLRNAPAAELRLMPETAVTPRVPSQSRRGLRTARGAIIKALSHNAKRCKAFTAAVGRQNARSKRRAPNPLATHTLARKIALRVQHTAFKSYIRPTARPPQLFGGPSTRLPVSGATLIEYRPPPRRNDLRHRLNAGSRRPDHFLAPGQRTRRERAHSTFSLSRAAE